MTLKWVSALTATAALSAFGTVNAVMGWATNEPAPTPLNLILVATCAGGVILTVVAELYHRIDSRLSVLSDFLVTRLDEIADQLNDRDLGTAERGTTERGIGERGISAGQPSEEGLIARAVVPLGHPRGTGSRPQRRPGRQP